MSLELVSTFAKRLREALGENSITDFGKKIGLSKQAISSYVNGNRVPKRPTIVTIANTLGVNEAWLIGYDVPEQTPNYSNYDNANIKHISKQSLPVLGEIACGKPMFAEKQEEFYTMLGVGIKADFVLIARGDSMIGARIHDGDFVFIRKQEMVSNGEIAAVVIEDDATLKRVFYYPEKSKLVLQAENPKYEPLVYVGEELGEIRILGKAVAFQSDVK